MRKAIEETADGCIIHLVVKFGPETCFPAGYDEWRKRIVIQVNGEPIKGRANNEILSRIAICLNIPKQETNIIYGIRSREKGVFVKTSVAAVEHILNDGL